MRVIGEEYSPLLHASARRRPERVPEIAAHDPWLLAFVAMAQAERASAILRGQELSEPGSVVTVKPDLGSHQGAWDLCDVPRRDAVADLVARFRWLSLLEGLTRAERVDAGSLHRVVTPPREPAA